MGTRQVIVLVIALMHALLAAADAEMPACIDFGAFLHCSGILNMGWATNISAVSSPTR